MSKKKIKSLYKVLCVFMQQLLICHSKFALIEALITIGIIIISLFFCANNGINCLTKAKQLVAPIADVMPESARELFNISPMCD